VDLSEPAAACEKLNGQDVFVPDILAHSDKPTASAPLSRSDTPVPMALMRRSAAKNHLFAGSDGGFVFVLSA
jgi:hypothetical protein